MYLLVDTKGNKYFRLDYRFGGKRKTLALGVYPDTTLKQAREKRDEARQQIADGIDPSANKKAVKLTKATMLQTALKLWRVNGLNATWAINHSGDSMDESNAKIV